MDSSEESSIRVGSQMLFLDPGEFILFQGIFIPSPATTNVAVIFNFS